MADLEDDGPPELEEEVVQVESSDAPAAFSPVTLENLADPNDTKVTARVNQEFEIVNLPPNEEAPTEFDPSEENVDLTNFQLYRFDEIKGVLGCAGLHTLTLRQNRFLSLEGGACVCALDVLLGVCCCPSMLRVSFIGGDDVWLLRHPRPRAFTQKTGPL